MHRVDASGGWIGGWIGGWGVDRWLDSWSSPLPTGGDAAMWRHKACSMLLGRDAGDVNNWYRGQAAEGTGGGGGGEPRPFR